MKSQRQQVLEYLLTGEAIASNKAWRDFSITRLADVIWKIRKQWPVHTDLMPYKHPSGARTRFAVYHMPKSVIAAYRANKSV